MAAPSVTRPPIPALHAALAGVAAAGVALATGEVMAALLPGVPSLVAAVGSLVIDLQPPGAKELVVGLFGTADKAVLELTVVGASVAIGAALGIIGRSRPAVATAGFGLAGLAGFGAAAADPQTTAVLAALSAALAAFLGMQVLHWLLARAADASTPSASGTGPDQAANASGSWSRREFLVRSGAIGVAALAFGVAGRALLTRASAVAASIPYPRPLGIASLPAGADFALPGLTPIVEPNDTFYRIDTALLVPRVDPASWQLRVHGMVDRETVLTFPELLNLGLFEQYVTIACVSNDVGGNLVGNAKWTGVHLRDVLALAGVRPGATQLVGRSVDGWTAGMPTAWVMDPSREPMIAVLMNDEPLPDVHGFPARLIVPGLYGYVSATKWLSELELTTLEAFDAFWVPRGWAKEAPILTQSRIDLPRNGDSVGTGTVTIAGIAWAPDRGVSRVEVAVDGQWREAQLSRPIADTTWVQWRTSWQPAPGSHTLQVRATDGHGAVQPAGPTPPAPDGARGFHTIQVSA